MPSSIPIADRTPRPQHAAVLPFGAPAIDAMRASILACRPFAMPTETVYGLAANALCEESVAGIFQAKGRPANNPLIVHIPDYEAAARLVDLDAAGCVLARSFWPGPLTIVASLRPGSGVSGKVTAGLSTLGVRVPSHPTAQAVLQAAGVPLAAPSANRSGRISPTSASDVEDELAGRIDLIIDGGTCDIGVESTIVQIDSRGGVHLLRPGGVPVEAIDAALTKAGFNGCVTPEPRNADVRLAASAPLVAPGQLASHYAPRLPVRLDAAAPFMNECLLAFGPLAAPPPTHGWYQLSETGDLAEAASRLFDGLRTLDRRGAREGATGIAVAPIPHQGLGAAINDRLTRAAAPRDERLP
ncbi:MAG: L-threonylcarbamoyladenylate synthase [Pseudomonadota bacterium]